MRVTTRNLKVFIFIIISGFIFIHFLLIGDYYDDKVELLRKVVLKRDSFINDLELSPSKSFVYPFVKNFERKDWHDYKFIEYEKSRVGPGEQGKPYKLTDPQEIKLNDELFKIEGFYVVVSDKISVNRSVPDTRHILCKEMTYLKNLPTVSIIIIYHNEYPSTLKRTIHSIVNRSPPELIHEIILVDDASTRRELREDIPQYVKDNFPKARILNLPKKSGLIMARVHGARQATGEILVFLDAHVEVNVNWLPPLIEPIKIEPKTATTPIIDSFSHDTLEYHSGGEGSRGIFDWKLVYHQLYKLPEDRINPIKPSKNPIMLGCVFAIRRDYFFDLGAYDEQFLIWNAENYELSFKLWLCGGQLLEVPCSRVAHTFRKHNEWRKLDGVDFVGHNFKRLAEVWFDEFKETFYKSDPIRYGKIDFGDISREKKIRQDLNCKPFIYMLEVVMPDMVERYPYKDLGIFAKGVIRSEADKNLCVDTLGQSNEKTLGLYQCHRNLTDPPYNQKFIFNWHRQILIVDSYDRCLDTNNVSMGGCHFSLGHQLWIFKPEARQIYNPPNNCLTADMKTKKLKLSDCVDNDINQKWSFGYENRSALENWRTFGIKLPKNIKIN